jgi:type II secretory pathway component PulC
MHYYNSNREKLSRDAKIQQLTSKIERMKDVMGENIQLMLRRGETLESMNAKAESMKRDSVVFKKQSNQLKNQFRWKHWKYRALIALFVAGIFYVCLTAACGFRFQHCRVRDRNSSNNNNSNNNQNDQGQEGNRV